MTHRTRVLTTAILLAIAVLVDVAALQIGLNPKLFWASMSTAITIAGYVVYISQMYPTNEENTVKPEPYSWILFGLFTATGAIVQIAQGGGAGSWCLAVTAFMCFLISGWSYAKWRSEWPFNLDRKIYVGAALGLFGLSIFKSHEAGWALFSAITATMADIVGYGPTFRKAWLFPKADSVTNFTFNSVKCIPALLALESYSLSTVVYLAMLILVNGGFALFLSIRRHQIRREMPRHS